MTVLTQATHQWSTRPADERFSDLKTLHDAALRFRENARESRVQLGRIIPVATSDGEVALSTPSSHVTMTNWAFGQLCRKVEAPPAFLRMLPPELAVDVLRARLTIQDQAETVQALMHRNGTQTVRALTTETYTRVWNADVTARLLRLQDDGPWQPAPAAFDGSRGLYLSDHDVFAFLVDNNRRIFETGPAGGLSRGFFVWNSEVGAASLGISTFLYEYICGNHRVWGAQMLSEVRLRHVGKALDRWGALSVELTRYADASASDDETRIQRTRQYILGADKGAVLDTLFGLRVPELTRARIGEAYALAEKREDWYGNPRSAWGMAGALTEMARDNPHADERVALDRAAGRVMALAV